MIKGSIVTLLTNDKLHQRSHIVRLYQYSN